MPDSARPTTFSASPRRYTFAVSKKLMPSSNALCMQATAESSSTDPPYVSHEPSDISDTRRPVLPRWRYSTKLGRLASPHGDALSQVRPAAPGERRLRELVRRLRLGAGGAT